MKFEGDAQVQIGDKNIDRSQGAARAISVRFQLYLCRYLSLLQVVY